MTYLLAATEEIRRPDSPIARFLHSQFPILADHSDDFECRMRGAETLAPDAPGPDYPWSLVGSAIDYRIRFFFERVWVTRLPAFRSVQGISARDEGSALGEQTMYTCGATGAMAVPMPTVCAELFTALYAFLRRVRPARRRLSRDDEAWLCRYCAALALVDVKRGQQGLTQKHPLHVLPPGATLDDLFALIPRAAVLDTIRLSHRFQAGTARAWLSQTVTFDPHVWIGNLGASPDVRVGNCLLDLKTTIRPQFSRAWLDQLLLYLLAVQNRNEIHHLGFHLVRQDRTISWPTNEFIARSSGTADLDVDRLSREFFDITSRSSRLPPCERWQEPG